MVLVEVVIRMALARNTRTVLLLLLVANTALVLRLGFSHTSRQTKTPSRLTRQTKKFGGLRSDFPRNPKMFHGSASLYKEIDNIHRKKLPTAWPTMAPDPKSPLSTERYTIVRKSPVVNLTFEPVNTTNHPHMGAPLYDVRMLSRGDSAPEFNLPNQSAVCSYRDADSIALERIRVATPEMIQNATNGRKPIKLLCVIYSSSQFHNKISAIRETWGPRCDGFFVASNVTDASVNAINIPHLGKEMYENMWNKIRSIWSYIYQNYFNEFDYFHLAGEDTWVIVENLRYYLNGDELAIAANGGYELPETNITATHQTPLYLGLRFARDKNYSTTFHTGGPGYTLNKAALKLLVTQGLHKDRSLTSAEDFMVSKLFLELGVHPYPTRELDTKSERYHHLNPGLHMHAGQLKRPHAWVDWWMKPFHHKHGENHSSVYSAAFHYMYPNDMRRYHALLYDHCDRYIPHDLGPPTLNETLLHSVKVQDAVNEYKMQLAKRREAKSQRQNLLAGRLGKAWNKTPVVIQYNHTAAIGAKAETLRQQMLNRKNVLEERRKQVDTWREKSQRLASQWRLRRQKLFGQQKMLDSDI